MKRFLSFLLISVMIFLCCACGDFQLTSHKTGSSDSEGDVISEDTDVYTDIAEMLPSIFAFVEYNHISNNSIDYEDVNAEDFWNIVAIVVSSFEKSPEIIELDDVGVYHLSWEETMEFAKAFMYKSWHKNNAPNYKSSYSASADPGSGVIDIVPLSVDNFEASLVSIEAVTSGSEEYDYILKVDLSTGEENPTIHHYNVFVANWENYIRESYGEVDEDTHIMPFVVTGFKYISTDEP